MCPPTGFGGTLWNSGRKSFWSSTNSSDLQCVSWSHNMQMLLEWWTIRISWWTCIFPRLRIQHPFKVQYSFMYQAEKYKKTCSNPRRIHLYQWRVSSDSGTVIGIGIDKEFHGRNRNWPTIFLLKSELESIPMGVESELVNSSQFQLLELEPESKLLESANHWCGQGSIKEVLRVTPPPQGMVAMGI